MTVEQELVLAAIGLGYVAFLWWVLRYTIRLAERSRREAAAVRNAVREMFEAQIQHLDRETAELERIFR